MAKEAFNKKEELLRGKLSKDLKKRMVKVLVWSVALYASETWTVRNDDTKRLEAFEMWIWRRVEKISWKEHITNDKVLTMSGNKDRWWTQSEKDKETGSVTYSEEIQYWEQYWKGKSKAEEQEESRGWKWLTELWHDTRTHQAWTQWIEIECTRQSEMASSPSEPADGREL